MVPPIEWKENRHSLGKILCSGWGFGNQTFIVEAKVKKDSSAVYLLPKLVRVETTQSLSEPMEMHEKALGEGGKK